MSVLMKVKVLGSGTEKDPFRVNLPTYRMVKDINRESMTCWVFVPKEFVKGKKLDENAIRTKYGGWKDFDRKTVEV